jgi:hypothetical protein
MQFIWKFFMMSVNLKLCDKSPPEIKISGQNQQFHTSLRGRPQNTLKSPTDTERTRVSSDEK